MKLYSPRQVFLGSFLGGPFAAVFFLKENFEALNNDKAAKKTVWIGGVGSLLMIASLGFLPEKFPQIIIPLAYSGVARGCVEGFQRTKKDILANPSMYTFQSSRRIAIVAILGLIAFLLLAGVYLFAMQPRTLD